jgi:hypothetical protein
LLVYVSWCLVPSRPAGVLDWVYPLVRLVTQTEETGPCEAAGGDAQQTSPWPIAIRCVPARAALPRPGSDADDLDFFEGTEVRVLGDHGRSVTQRSRRDPSVVPAEPTAGA